MGRWRPKPIHLLTLLACLVCDLVAPLYLVRNDEGFLALLMFLAWMAGLLAAPVLLFLLLYAGGRKRWAVPVAAAQFVLGLVTFAGGAQPLHAVYLTVLGRPVEAVVADSARECGHHVTGQAAEIGPYVCTATLELVRPDGEAVAGGGMHGNEFADARLEAAMTDGNPADSITVLEDPLGLVSPRTADPATGRPDIGDFGRIHAVVLVICWIVFAGSLAAALVTGRRRPRTESPVGDETA
ncbi:hypothetical protein ACFFMN_28985 [Planobispora siamensis]|uniref:Uncharacterized protein n=1 Tax=Planobispora siamensis TaxID=936338 RepID=A0A8J3SBT3_9ACTN|nr:hypothetical protein [Planobispora siamensis]GIH91781.1 hypothetical protein Psi01_24110 [Planobispora siamensis]